MMTPCRRRSSWSTRAIRRRRRGAPERPRTRGAGRRKSPVRRCATWTPSSTTSAIASATPSRTAVSTAPSSRITRPSTPRSARCGRSRPGYAVAMRLPARSSTVAAIPGRAGEAERRAGEAERQDRLGVRTRVEQQVPAGDADVEPARADVDRDVAGAEEEELGVVLRVQQDEFAGVATLRGSPLRRASGWRVRRAIPCWGRRCGAWLHDLSVRRDGRCRFTLQMSVDVVERDALRPSMITCTR